MSKQTQTDPHLEMTDSQLKIHADWPVTFNQYEPVNIFALINLNKCTFNKDVGESYLMANKNRSIDVIGVNQA